MGDWEREPAEPASPDPIDAELAFHFAETVESLMARGWSAQQARAEAARRFGDRDRYRRDLETIRRRRRRTRGPIRDAGRRAVWFMHLLEPASVVRDVRYAAHSLRRSPGFTLAAVLALALGIGANTAVFSVVNAVLLRPLPFTDPDRLVMVFNGAPRGGASIADFLDWKARSRSFATLDVFEINRFTNSRFTWTGDGEPTQVLGFSVTATFFETLGVRPLIGRTFTAGEDEPGRPRSVVISERFWRRRYASSPDALGKTAVLNGRPHTIVGVIPAPFELWQRDVDAWAILTLDSPTFRGPLFVRGVARLKPGVTVEQAAAEMAVIAGDIERSHPTDYQRHRIPVIPLREIVVGDIRPLLGILSCAVALVLLIAVSNVANLLLGRASDRRREIAVRLSVGAARGQIVRQLLAESLMLATAGGAIGIALAAAGVAALRSLAPPDVPRLGEIAVDLRVLAFTAVAAVVSAVLFGLVPAIVASDARLTESLGHGGRSGESPRRGRARAALVVAQVTLSVILLVGAGLLIRSFDLLGRVNPGFQAAPSRMLTMFVSPTGPRFDRPGAVNAYWRQLLERVRALPGVEAASLSNALPPDRRGINDTYGIVGKPLSAGASHPMVPVPFVSHDYFQTIGVPLLRGRWFGSQDTATSPRVAIISREMEQRHFSGEDAIGQRLAFGGQELEIIGVVGNVKYQGLNREDDPVFYLLSVQAELWDLWLLVRTAGDAQASAAMIREEVRALDPEVPIERVGTMSQAVSQSVSLPRFRSLLMTVFAATALLLAAIGIYSVIAYSVAQRKQEIGVRMALGATPSGVLALVVGQASRLAIIGIAVGVIGASGLTQVLKQMLFGVTTSDAVTFAGAALVVGTVAVVASLVPAFVAARTDPARALRAE